MDSELTNELKELAETFFFQSINGWKHHAKASGLSMPQIHLLMSLYHGDKLGVNEIGGRMEITSAAASQLIDRLVNAGFAARCENPDDRRGRTISITEKGRAFVEEGAQEHYRWLNDLVAQLHSGGREAVHAAMKHLLEAAHAINCRTHSCPQYIRPAHDIHGEV